MASDQYTGNLEEQLDRLKDQILRDLLAKGHQLSEVEPNVAQVRGQIRAQFAGSSASTQQLTKDVTDAFLTLVMAQGFRLSAKLVSNTLAVRGQLNHRQAICLWLGLFFDQSSSCEGLWQMYVDYRTLANGTPLSFPELISAVCGELEAPDADELQDKIFDYWETQMDQANEALGRAELAPMQPKDIPSFIAWILATRLDEQSPQDAAQSLGRTLIGVHNDLRRGYHTLLCKYLEDVYTIIDRT